MRHRPGRRMPVRVLRTRTVDLEDQEQVTSVTYPVRDKAAPMADSATTRLVGVTQRQGSRLRIRKREELLGPRSSSVS